MAIKASATITLFDVVDIESTTWYYLLQSSTASVPAKPTTATPSSNWKTTEPAYTEGSTNTLYTVMKTTYSDGSFEYTPVSKSTSYEAAKIAYNKAVAANDTANNASTKADLLSGDPSNYSQLNDTTASYWGFTADTTADGHWYTMNNLGRDKNISNWYECNGGEIFSIDFEISTSCQANTTNSTTTKTIDYVKTTIGLATSDDAGKNYNWLFAARITGSEEATATKVSSTVTINKKARKFRVFIQTEAWNTFSGTIKVRNVRVRKCLVQSTDIEYYLSTSNTALSGGSWSTTAPTWVNGKYMWSRTKTTLQNGSVTYKPSENGVCIAGAKGDTGNTGATGKGISSITEEYYLSTSKTTQTGGSWSTTAPTWSSGKYVWTRSKIVYSNPTSTVYTTPICDSSWEAINDIEVGGRNLIYRGKGNVKDGFFKNFSTVTEEYGELTLTSKKQYSYILINPGCILKGRDYKVGAQVTWSYDIMYTEWNFPEGTNHADLWMGQRYVNGPSGSTGQWVGITKHNLPVVGSNGCELNEWFHVEKTLTIPKQASEGVSTAASIQFYNSNAEVEASFTFRLKNVKLEYGNKATDWMPAPEDVDNNIKDLNDKTQERFDDVNSSIESAQSSIDTLKNMISHLVTDANGGSLMTQTSNGWTFNMSSITGNLDAIKSAMATMDTNNQATNNALNSLTSLVNNIANKTAYITMSTDENGDPCIELGKSDNTFKVRITNTAIDFLEGSTKIAYANNNTFYVEIIIAKKRLQIGERPGYSWAKRENGNLGLTYIVT